VKTGGKVDQNRLLSRSYPYAMMMAGSTARSKKRYISKFQTCAAQFVASWNGKFIPQRHNCYILFNTRRQLCRSSGRRLPFI